MSAEFGADSPVQIAVLNHATTPLGVDLAAMVAALQKQVDRDFAPAWSCNGSLFIVPPDAQPDPQDWLLTFLDDSDQAGALGYHEVTPAGMPVMKVFVKDTIADGDSVSSCASHELMETLADPATNVLRMASTGTIYIQEVADPVEADTYLIDGIPVSNFVYPSWFEPWHAPGSIAFDYLNKLQAPFALDKGGYISVLRRNRWTQVFGSEAAEAAFARKRRRKHRLMLLERQMPTIEE